MLLAEKNSVQGVLREPQASYPACDRCTDHRLTQVLCAWWIASTIERTSVDEGTVESIDRSLDRIADHFAPQ